MNTPITVVTAKADAVQGTVAVIWKSKKAIPTQRSDTVEVRARFATPSDLMHLRMDDSLPLRFDEVAAVIIVDGVAEYE